MPYTHFRYIAYQVPTVMRNAANNAFLEMPPGNITGNAAINNPIVNNPTINRIIATIPNLDARERVARLYLAMFDAANHLAVPGRDNRNTLKVFIAPEFYFRPTSVVGGNGPAYTYTEYKAIKQALRDLARETIQMGYKYRFQDWLIIPGTIMWEGTNNQMGDRPPTADRVYFNTCPYITIGGWTGKGGAAIEKEMASTIDGLPTGRHGVPALPPAIGVGGGNPKATNEVWTLYQTPAKKKKHVFEHYGTYCGLEICLEHGISLLKDLLSDLVGWSYRSGIRTLRKSISLQLITAGGMRIANEKVAVKNGGYILRNDGLGGVPPQVQIEKVRNYVGTNNQNVGYGHKPSLANFCVPGNPIGYVNPARVVVPIAMNRRVPAPAGHDPNYYFQEQLIIYNSLLLV